MRVGAGRSLAGQRRLPTVEFVARVNTLLGSSNRAFWLYDDPRYLWQDTSATTAVTAAGNPVGRVDDLSGNGKHLLQGTGANQPAFQINPGRVVFDGANDNLQIAAAAFPTDAFELFQVVEQRSNVQNAALYTFAPSSGNDYDNTNGCAVSTGDNAKEFQIVGSSTSSMDGQWVGTASAPTPFGLWEVRKAASTVTCYKNANPGTTDSSFTALASTHSGAFLDGARYISSAVAAPYGNIDRRCTVMTAALTEQQRSQLRELIRNRYSIW